MNNSALYAFNMFGDTVLRAAFAMTGNYQEAEDITQEVFLTLHSKPRSFDSDEHMKAWLLRSAINRSKNYRMSASVRRDQPLSDELADKLSCEFTPRDNEIREMITKLPEKYASVILRRYVDGGGDPAEVFCERDGKKVQYSDVVKEVERNDG